MSITIKELKADEVLVDGQQVFHRGRKPSASDVGALAVGGTAVNAAKLDNSTKAQVIATARSGLAASNHTHAYVPVGRKVNGLALSADISLNSGHVGALAVGGTAVNAAKLDNRTKAQVIAEARSGLAASNHTHSPSQVGLSNVPNTIHSSSPTANTVPLRDGSGDLQARLVRTNYADEATPTGGLVFRKNNSSDNYHRVCNNTTNIRNWLGASEKSHNHADIVKKINDLDATNIQSRMHNNTIYDAFEHKSNFDDPLAFISEGETSILTLGDSITSGARIADFEDSYIYKFNSSLWKHFDFGLGQSNSFKSETYADMGITIKQRGVSTNGVIVEGGTVDSQLRLNANQHLTMTDRQVVYCDFYYDKNRSNCVVEILHNGAVVRTLTIKPTAAQGVACSFPTGINSGFVCQYSDTSVIKVKTGSLYLCGLMPLNRTASSPLSYVISKSGCDFTYFYSDLKIQHIADYFNLFREKNKKLLVVNLGTNSIYSQSASVDAAGYISQLNTLITKIKAKVSNLHVLVEVPAQADHSRFPIFKDTYPNYVKAILKYCNDNGYAALRLDQTSLSGGKHCSDGIHPNEYGHSILAKKMCDAVGIPYKPFRKTDSPPFDGSTDGLFGKNDLMLNGGWVYWNDGYVTKAISSAGITHFTGIVKRSTGSDPVIGYVPYFFAPKGHDVYLPASSNIGVINLHITVGGYGQSSHLRVSAADSGKVHTIIWISLAGLSYFSGVE